MNTGNNSDVQIIRLHETTALEQLANLDLTRSKILQADIRNSNYIISSDKENFKHILVDIIQCLKYMVRIPISKIFQGSKINVMQPDQILNPENQSAYRRCESLNLWLQNQNSNGTCRDICFFIKKYKLQANIRIKLADGSELHIIN